MNIEFPEAPILYTRLCKSEQLSHDRQTAAEKERKKTNPENAWRYINHKYG